MDTIEQLVELAHRNPLQLALVVAGVWLLFWIERRRSVAMIRRWCDANGYRLIRARRAIGLLGAFPLASRRQSVWRITAEDRQLGGRRRGHARCGSFFAGLWADEVAVEWEFSERELSNGLDLEGARTG